MKPLLTDIFAITRELITPCLLLDCVRVRHNVQDIQQALPNVQIYYALKCNPDPAIVCMLHTMGIGFEIASLYEAQILLDLGVPSNQMICLHPIKSPEFLLYLHANAIDVLAVDSFEEVEKIALYAPGSKIVARVDVPSQNSVWPLSGKFGIASDEIPRLLSFAKNLGLLPYGLTMHVGTQCTTPDAWTTALKICQGIWDRLSSMDISLQLMSLGGGLPAPYRKPIASKKEIGQAIAMMNPHAFNPSGCRVTIEPGRAIVATAGVLVTSVVGLARRGDHNWAYIDAGIYSGLIEAILSDDRQFYPILVEDVNRPEYVYHIGGPTCDSLDSPFRSVKLPSLQVGDRLCILNAGAYSTTTAAPFNGFLVPNIHHR